MVQLVSVQGCRNRRESTAMVVHCFIIAVIMSVIVKGVAGQAFTTVLSALRTDRRQGCYATITVVTKAVADAFEALGHPSCIIHPTIQAFLLLSRRSAFPSGR